MKSKVTLRSVDNGDVKIFFNQQLDSDANFMAAFISRDPNDWEAFATHWKKIRANEQILIKTIEIDEKAAGYILSFIMDERREVGYWIGKEYWGRGIATSALREYCSLTKVRPLYAHVAFDNFGSIRVLEKCSFRRIDESTYFAKARGEEIQEFIYMLSG